MKRVFSLPERSHGTGALFFTWQRKSCNYLVTTGFDNCLNIYNRHGDKVEQVNLPGFCSGMSWDSDGEILGLITDRSANVILWDANSHKVSRLDTGVRDSLTLLIWSRVTPLLAVGTSKGNLLIYDHQSQRKIPVLGKHSKKIAAGAWSDQNLLALIGDDRMLTISNKDGDTMSAVGLKGDPTLPQWACLKPEGRGNTTTQNAISVILNNKVMYILNIHESEMPYMFAFQEDYGGVVDYQWFGDGLIVVGFATGMFVVISTQTKEMGTEIAQFRGHKEQLSSMALCHKTKKLATCAENVVKVWDTDNDNVGEVEEVVTLDDEKSITWLEWSEEGSMLAVGCSSGALHVYLAKLSVVGGVYGTRMAFLSSLLEVTVISGVDSDSDSESCLTIRIDVEPSIIAVGPYHVGVAMNNRVWFYALTGPEQQFLLKEKEYVGILRALKLNGDYAAALFTDGRLFLHVIESNEGNSINEEVDNRESRIFPETLMGERGKITAVALTDVFLIFATDGGTIEFFMLEDWAVVNIYRHSCGIRQMATDPNGLRLVALDEMNNCFVYNAVTDSTLEIPNEHLPSSTKSLLWENCLDDRGVFTTSDGKHLYVFVYVQESIEGASVEFVGTSKIPTGQFPLLLFNGLIVCQTQSGKTSNFILTTHDFAEMSHDKDRLRDEILPNILKLRRLADAWKICEFLGEYEPWASFGRAALYDMNVPVAIRVYRTLHEPGMVMSLLGISELEERALLAGHLAAFLEKYDLAQTLFLTSTQPMEALVMRQNIQDWDTALVLAKRLAPYQTPAISREYAIQLEFDGDYHAALDHYEKALISHRRNSDAYGAVDDEEPAEDDRVKSHNERCKAGIARCAIRCGNTKRGIDFAMVLKNNREVHLECAEILEGMKLYSDAASLYEMGGNYEKAASFYLRMKNGAKVAEIIENVNSKSILIEYAISMEAEGKYREAMKAYGKAGDSIQVVRILLDELNNPGEAVKIVKELKSVEGAKMVARFFQKLNDMSSAIEFLVLSKCNEEAFHLASSTGQMDIYANVLLGIQEEQTYEIPLSDFHSIALFYEQDKNALMAGKFYCLSQNYRKGVKLLLTSASLTSANESEAIRLIIDAAAKCKDEQVMRQVIDFLIGETDGMPKDFKYLFRLYMSLGHYREAAKTAIIIAREEQSAGNYRNSHDLLFGMAQELKKQNIKIPSEMNSSLMLIHSYLLAKVWVKIGDHVHGAQLLIRVGKNISRFPAHTVPILTSAVVACQRAGYRKTAINFAMMLMKPEYREMIDSKFKKKIETLVRKSAGIRRSADEDITSENMDGNGSLSPCPFCFKDLPELELFCSSCKNTIPFCIATGHHVIREDLAFCPNCDFPATLTNFIRLLESEPQCPMCSKAIDVSEVVPATPDQVNVFLNLDSNT